MRASLILKSVTVTWAAVFVAAATNLLLTPLILHRLGDEAYGIWVLVVTLADYYSFLQVGVRSAIVRYVSKYLALNDLNSVRRVVASSFYFYLGLAAFVLGIVFSVKTYVPRFFAVSPVYRDAFITLFVLLGVAFYLQLGSS